MTAKQKANRERFKKVVAEAKKLRKKNPKLSQAQAVKQAWAIMYSKTGTSKKVGAVKKKSAKKATAKSYHKDTKSHNVRISVMSGVDDKINFWVNNFAPRKRSTQLQWYRELKDHFKYGHKNIFETKENLIAQLRALEYILNKKPFKIN